MTGYARISRLRQGPEASMAIPALMERLTQHAANVKGGRARTLPLKTQERQAVRHLVIAFPYAFRS